MRQVLPSRDASYTPGLVQMFNERKSERAQPLLCYEASPSDRKAGWLVRLSFSHISHKRKVEVMFDLGCR